MGAGVKDRFLHGGNNKIRRRQIRIADPQIDYIDAPSFDLVLDAVDFLKEIRGELFEPFGEFKDWHKIMHLS